ncbi:unnamed protein product [Cuscuta epithymum]|uniref:peptidylprolyl isomerase n=1 Tax=Cuscuta epithymum TaxID=186058 RepID=A0AAV0D9B1_9ASTE|nr:unnamed protein product [Cuscuta epithymum]
MSFWGIEVKPAKPVTHVFDQTRGRLRISQATLGIGSANTKSLVQCNVGNKAPLFLCALLPERTESCHLDLEFEEAENVVFSVLGPRSIHLTGYYVGKSSNAHLGGGGSDTESYGEDVGYTDTDVSNECSDEDEYEDSFIDDGEPEVLPSSPISSDEDVAAEGSKRGNQWLRKKHQVIDSDDDENTPENEASPKKLSSQSGEDSGKVTVQAENGVGGTEENVDISDAETAKSEKPSKKRKSKSDNAKSVEVPVEVKPLAEEGSANGQKLKKRRKGNKGEKVDECKDSCPINTHEKVKQNLEATNTVKDLIETPDENKLQSSAQNDDANCGVANGQHMKKHEKKKNKKTKVVDEGANNGVSVESCGIRTLSNGLTTEDLAIGEADGKIATPGKKVKIYYTGILKENKQVFDSNIGETPFKFRLGDKRIIDGWNIGLEGMRVGGKRRLVIPPSMGYGSQGGGENIPPNSWLIYEVELVGVLK